MQGLMIGLEDNRGPAGDDTDLGKVRAAGFSLLFSNEARHRPKTLLGEKKLRIGIRGRRTLNPDFAGIRTTMVREGAGLLRGGNVESLQQGRGRGEGVLVLVTQVNASALNAPATKVVTPSASAPERWALRSCGADGLVAPLCPADTALRQLGRGHATRKKTTQPSSKTTTTTTTLP